MPVGSKFNRGPHKIPNNIVLILLRRRAQTPLAEPYRIPYANRSEQTKGTSAPHAPSECCALADTLRVPAKQQSAFFPNCRLRVKEGLHPLICTRIVAPVGTSRHDLLIPRRKAASTNIPYSGSVQKDHSP